MVSARSDNRPADNPFLKERFLRTRRLSLELTRPLEAEDHVVQTIPEVSPTKWHLAHVTWFFEHFCLGASSPEYRPYDERFHYLFNSYYRTVGEMHSRPERGRLSRPTVAEIHAYRRYVDEAMVAALEEHPGDAELEFLVTLGLNHEQQHQELLLTDIKHVYFVNPLAPTYHGAPVVEASHPSALAFKPHPGGQFEIGAGNGGFCFDNETPRHTVLLRDFALANRLVTNGEYREFMEDGGYENPALWLADGWSAVDERGWNRPLYWSHDFEREFTLAGWRALDRHAPVSHVSFYEADAFARWAGARLPTEAEWEVAAAEIPIDGNFLETGALHPVPAREGSALRQMYGDVWEWTASAYGSYPGFRPLDGSLGEYNGKFMCNQVVVRGGSCVTQRDHIRPTYRSFFYPHDRWQFLGFRLARDL